MERFPQNFKLEDNQRVVLEFEALLRRHGLHVPRNSSLERAMLGAVEMFETHKDKSLHDRKSDCRDPWRQTLSIGGTGRAGRGHRGQISRACCPNQLFETFSPRERLVCKL